MLAESHGCRVRVRKMQWQASHGRSCTELCRLCGLSPLFFFQDAAVPQVFKIAQAAHDFRWRGHMVERECLVSSLTIPAIPHCQYGIGHATPRLVAWNWFQCLRPLFPFHGPTPKSEWRAGKDKARTLIQRICLAQA